MTDSHGVPWAGRRLEPAPFADDEGGSDAAVLTALRELAAADPGAASAAESRLLDVLAGARVLVPIVAVPAEDDTQDGNSMATALLAGPDGSRALPVFTGVAGLSAWDPAARPVPMRVPEAARSALDEGCAAMPIDLADEHAAVLRGSQLWALALGERWLPAHTDPVVRLAVAEAGQGIDGLVRAQPEDGSLHGPGTMRLVLTLRPGLSGSVVEAVVARLGERLAADPDVRRRIDDLAVVLHQANEPADQVPPDEP